VGNKKKLRLAKFTEAQSLEEGNQQNKINFASLRSPREENK